MSKMQKVTAPKEKANLEFTQPGRTRTDPDESDADVSHAPTKRAKRGKYASKAWYVYEPGCVRGHHS